MTPMFLAGLSVLLSLTCVIVTAILAIGAEKHAAYARSCADWVADNNKRTKILRLEAELTTVVDDIAALRETLHKMRSRIGMRELREKKKEAETTPEFANTQEGRDAERVALEKELAESGRLNARIHQNGA